MNENKIQQVDVVDSYLKEIGSHYSLCWNQAPESYQLSEGSYDQMPRGFSVLEFDPTEKRKMWTYATCGMSHQGDAVPLELHLFSSKKDLNNVELLTSIAHYHLTGSYLNLNHTVNFGRPWTKESKCDYGLISLPYLDGPTLEWRVIKETKVRFLWLIPLTKQEVEFKKQYGIEKLESLFEDKRFNYLNAERESVV